VRRAISRSASASTAENGDDYRAIVKNSDGSRTTQWGTLDVVAAPLITKNPASTKTLHRGQQFSFSSAASGDPAPVPTWQISLDGGTTWQVLSTGRSDVSFSLPSVPPASGAEEPATTRAATVRPATAKPQDLVRVIYQNAYGTATSKTAVLAFADSYPDVGVAASVSPNPVVAGTAAAATVTVGDYSGVRATKVIAVSTFATSLGLKSIREVSGPKATCTTKSVHGGKAVSCSWATLSARSQAVFRASLMPAKKATNGAITVSATLAQHNGILGQATLTVPIAKPWADVQVSGTTKKSVKVGTEFADVLTVRDAGPSSATKVKVTAVLPANVKLVKKTTGGAKCRTVKATLTCTIASMKAGQLTRLTLLLKGVKKGVCDLVASVSSATVDYESVNNSLSLSTVIR